MHFKKLDGAGLVIHPEMFVVNPEEMEAVEFLLLHHQLVTAATGDLVGFAIS
ncbi:hypothetical protein D9M73_296240 [compost metagenome]